MEAKCLIVCEGAGISKTITKVANERDCIIISTSYDTYTVARLINQSMPIEFLMKKKEDGLISFNTDDFIEDIQGIMAKKRHRDFPIEDNKNNYIGMISRRNLLGAGKKQIILVDHNEKGQAISGIETAQILEIIDHHRIGSIETVTPVFFRNQPLGCTATIICQMYHENNIEITPKIAYLLCSAIISDTLIFKSPTCTAEDIKACRELADIAGINIEEHGMEMFNAGSNLSSKTAKEIIMQDYKKFSVNDIKIGVGQINTMSQAEIDNIRGKIENYIDKVIADGGVDMVYLLMTNIMTESSEVVFAGKSAGSVLANAFNVQVNGKSAVLEKIVSRKKQFFPAIMETLQQ